MLVVNKVYTKEFAFLLNAITKLNSKGKRHDMKHILDRNSHPWLDLDGDDDEVGEGE